MLTGIADTLRAGGLDVVEVAGWKTRGHGPQVDVRTITMHHTAGPSSGDHPSLDIVRDGRPGLDGPLSHCLVARSGTWYVIAAGLCWHAGVSLSLDYENGHALGIECEGTGTDSWPSWQYDSIVRGTAALKAHYKPAHLLGHKETCSPPGRKIDPNWGMAVFRSHVAAVDLEAGMLTPDDKDWVKAQLGAAFTDTDIDRIWGKSNPVAGQSPAGAVKTTLDRVDADNLQAQVRNGIEVALQDLDHPLTARLAAIEAAIKAFADKPPTPDPTPVDASAAAIAQAVLDGLAARLQS